MASELIPACNVGLGTHSSRGLSRGLFFFFFLVLLVGKRFVRVPLPLHSLLAFLFSFRSHSSRY